MVARTNIYAFCNIFPQYLTFNPRTTKKQSFWIQFSTYKDNTELRTPQIYRNHSIFNSENLDPKISNSVVA